MDVHIFKGDGRMFGFTADSTGANLPLQYGAWRAFKTRHMVRGQAKIGFSVEACLDDIDKHGFHLMDAQTRITERAV